MKACGAGLMEPCRNVGKMCQMHSLFAEATELWNNAPPAVEPEVPLSDKCSEDITVQGSPAASSPLEKSGRKDRLMSAAEAGMKGHKRRLEALALRKEGGGKKVEV